MKDPYFGMFVSLGMILFIASMAWWPIFHNKDRESADKKDKRLAKIEKMKSHKK